MSHYPLMFSQDFMCFAGVPETEIPDANIRNTNTSKLENSDFEF
jgi:hypothetical protein